MKYPKIKLIKIRGVSLLIFDINISKNISARNIPTSNRCRDILMDDISISIPSIKDIEHDEFCTKEIGRAHV